MRDDEYLDFKSSHTDIHLCGHVHEHGTRMHSRGGAPARVSIIAGAVHMDKTVLPPDLASSVRLRDAVVGHGYSFGSIAVQPSDGEHLSIQIYPRRWSQRNNAYRWDVDELPDHMNHLSYSLTRMTRPRSVDPVLAPDPNGVVLDLGGGELGGAAVRQIVKASKRRVWHASLSDEIVTIRETLDAFSALRRELVKNRVTGWEYRYVANTADPRRRTELDFLKALNNLGFQAWVFERSGGNGLSLNFFIVDYDKTIIATKAEPHGIRFFLITSEPFCQFMSQVFLQETARGTRF